MNIVKCHYPFEEGFNNIFYFITNSKRNRYTEDENETKRNKTKRIVNNIDLIINARTHMGTLSSYKFSKHLQLL